MKLTSLGGSAAGPNPGQGCSGYLIESNGTHIVLDLGPGTLPELRLHADYRTLDAVVLSHLHLDHLLDILSLRYTLAYNPVPAPRPAPVWLPPGGRTLFTRIASAFSDPESCSSYFSVFALAEFDPDSPLKIGAVTVRFHPTVHYVPCWAMRISDGRSGDLFYTADTGPAGRLASFARGCRVVIAEGTARPETLEAWATRGHLTPFEAGALARDAEAETLVLTHLWQENDPFLALREAQEAFAGRVILAAPGMNIDWS